MYQVMMSSTMMVSVLETLYRKIALTADQEDAGYSYTAAVYLVGCIVGREYAQEISETICFLLLSNLISPGLYLRPSVYFLMFIRGRLLFEEIWYIMSHESWFIIKIATLFFAKTLIEHTPKNHL